MAEDPQWRCRYSRLVAQVLVTWIWASMGFPLGWLRIPRGLHSPSSLIPHAGHSPYKSHCAGCWNPLGSLNCYHPGSWIQLSRFGIQTWAGRSVANRAEESGRGCRILGVSGGGFSSVTSAFLTEYPAAEILAKFHVEQHVVDFGGVLMSFPFWFSIWPCF